MSCTPRAPVPQETLPALHMRAATCVKHKGKTSGPMRRAGTLKLTCNAAGSDVFVWGRVAAIEAGTQVGVLSPRLITVVTSCWRRATLIRLHASGGTPVRPLRERRHPLMMAPLWMGAHPQKPPRHHRQPGQRRLLITARCASPVPLKSSCGHLRRRIPQLPCTSPVTVWRPASVFPLGHTRPSAVLAVPGQPSNSV